MGFWRVLKEIHWWCTRTVYLVAPVLWSPPPLPTHLRPPAMLCCVSRGALTHAYSYRAFKVPRRAMFLFSPLFCWRAMQNIYPGLISTHTTKSSSRERERGASRCGLDAPLHRVCVYIARSRRFARAAMTARHNQLHTHMYMYGYVSIERERVRSPREYIICSVKAPRGLAMRLRGQYRAYKGNRGESVYIQYIWHGVGGGGDSLAP